MALEHEALFGERGAAVALAGGVAFLGVRPILVFGFFGGGVQQIGHLPALFALALFRLLAQVLEGFCGGVDVFHWGSFAGFQAA